MFFITIEKDHESLQLKVCIFCAEILKICATASEYIFYVEGCVAAFVKRSIFLNEFAATSERYQLTKMQNILCV